MKILSTISLVLLFTSIMAQGPTFEWAKGFGGTNSDDGKSVAVDADGNVYSTGNFVATVDFDPGVGTFNLTSSGTQDIFVQKLDEFGNFIWAKAIGSTGQDLGTSLTIDDSGDIYITGSYAGTVDFDPNAGVSNHTSAGGSDVFLLKMDGTGNFIWSKSIGGTGNESSSKIDTDGINNIFITGAFQQTADLDPGMGTSNATATGTSDVFVLKLDLSGNFIWAKTFQGSSLSIGVDNSGNVYTTGTFSGTVDLDPGVGVSNHTSAGSGDFFMQKLDGSGNFLWAKTFGGPSTENPFSLSIDSYGNVYSTGFFLGTANFDTGSGSTILSPNGSYDVFVHKLDPNGNFLWAKSFGGADSDFGRAITIDPFGNVYTTGDFSGTVDFDPGAGTFNLTATNFKDIFVHKMDASGNFVWVRSFGGQGSTMPFSIKVDAENNIYTTGKFGGTGDFDPNAGTSNLTSVGGDDIFVHKMSQCLPTSGTDIQIACDSYTWIDGNTYTADNNTATHTLTNAAGCDSVVTLDLTILNSTTGTDVQTACDSYTWIDGNSYTADNNTATHVLTNAAGCDSLVTLDLTITSSTTGTDVQSACDSYTWIDGNTYTTDNNTAIHTLTNAAGCDSVVTLDLTINNSNTGTDVQEACDEYTWIDGNTYNANNSTATFTLTNVDGCDSIVTLNLTINTVDVSVTNSSPTLSATVSGASYQWLDCDDNYAIILGETNQDFTATANGNYAVEITQNNCTDTSDCQTVNNVGIHNNTINVFRIYPNPTKGQLTIELSANNASEYRISDVTGRMIKEGTLDGLKTTIDVTNFKTQIYFIKIGEEVIKFAKQ